MAAVAAACRRLDHSATQENVRVFRVGGLETASPNCFRQWSFGKRRSISRSKFHDNTGSAALNPRKLIPQGVKLRDTLVGSGRRHAFKGSPSRCTAPLRRRGTAPGRIPEAAATSAQTSPDDEAALSASISIPSNSFLRQIPIQRLFIWSAIAFTTYQLKDFVGIFMGTFVLSVVGNSLVAWIQQLVPPELARRRRLLVASMYILSVLGVVGLGFIYLPGLTQELTEIVHKIQRSEDPYRVIADRLRVIMGEKGTDQLERFLLMAVNSADSAILEMSVRGSREQRSLALQALLNRYSGQLMSYLAAAVTATSRFALQGVVSLIFSFMIVWDSAAITRGLSSLRHSRLSAVYQEIAPVVVTFGRIFGKALQAQSAIAVANTALTYLGMLLFDIRGAAGLSLIVFLCSFVPVAGVILSTGPIGLVALTEGGFAKLGIVIIMVVLVHAVEAYILNPAIYSVHLKLHPIMALGVIVIAEHALGVWGLLVAVPMAVFIIEHLIMRAPITVEERNEPVLN